MCAACFFGLSMGPGLNFVFYIAIQYPLLLEMAGLWEVGIVSMPQFGADRLNRQRVISTGPLQVLTRASTYDRSDSGVPFSRREWVAFFFLLAGSLDITPCERLFLLYGKSIDFCIGKEIEGTGRSHSNEDGGHVECSATVCL